MKIQELIKLAEEIIDYADDQNIDSTENSDRIFEEILNDLDIDQLIQESL